MIAIAARRGSNRDISTEDMRMVAPGTTRGPRPRPRSAAATTRAGGRVPGAGLADALARPGVATAPAMQASTSTPCGRSSAHSPSARIAPNAFVAA